MKLKTNNFLIFFGYFFLFLFSLMCVNAIVINDNNVRAYYALEDLTDSTGRTGSLTNSGATSGAVGIINNSYDFDGVADYMDTGSQAFDTTEGSFSFWFNSDDATQYSAMVGEGNTFKVNTYNSGTHLLFNIGANSADATVTLNSGVWYHVVGIWGSGGLKLYLNNSLVASNAYTGTWTASANMLLGDTSTYPSFNGRLDEVSFWNKSLNSSEIDFLYNSNAPTSAQQFPFNTTTPIPTTPSIVSTLVNGGTYNNTFININLTTTSAVNMSYILNGGSKTPICTLSTDCNVTLSGLTTSTNNNISWISEDSNGIAYTNETFNIVADPLIQFNNITFLNPYSITTTSFNLTEGQNAISGDSYVDELNPTINYGSNVDLKVESESSTDMRSYIQIDLTGQNLNNINNVILNLYKYSEFSAIAGIDVEYYYCADTFNESSINWNNQATEVASCDGTPFQTHTLDDGLGWKQINLTEKIRTNLDNQFTIKIMSNPENYDGTPRYNLFHSSDYTTNTSRKPYIDYNAKGVYNYNTTNVKIFTETNTTFTNNNVNISYLINGFTPFSPQFVTNSLSGILNITSLYSDNFFARFGSGYENGVAKIGDRRVALNSTFPLNEAREAFCDATLNSDKSYGGSTIQFGSRNVTYWNGTDWYDVDNVANPSVLNIIDCVYLSEGDYNISFFAENNEVNVTSQDYFFSIDTTSPTIDIIGNITQNNYVVDFTTIFNITDISGLSSCTINITYLENITNASQYNDFINCTDTVNFFVAGDYNGFIEAVDNFGNKATLSVNGTIIPYVYINFFDENSTIITNYNINIYRPSNITESITNTSNPVNISPYYLGDLDLGTYIIEFIKDGYRQVNISIDINESSGGEVYNFTISDANIQILIMEIDDNLLTDPANFTILFYNIDDDLTQTFDIINNNTYLIPNLYAENTNVELKLVDNDGNILTNRQLILPRDDFNVTFYIATGYNLSERGIRILNPSLIPITYDDVEFYVYLPTTQEFVLLNTVETDNLGVARNLIIPSNFFYNVCHTYQGIQKCLNQITFSPTSTSSYDYEIVHDSTLTGEVRNILSYINWSYDEIKTNTTSKMSFYFNDPRLNVDYFCLNVSRNDVHLNQFCSTTPSGAIVQTFGLTTGQYLEYTFIYVMDGISTPFYKIKSYAEDPNIGELNEFLKFLFFILFFGLMGYLIDTNKFELYLLGTSGFLLVTLSIQAVISQDYTSAFLWGFLTLKSLVIYYVRVD